MECLALLENQEQRAHLDNLDLLYKNLYVEDIVNIDIILVTGNAW